MSSHLAKIQKKMNIYAKRRVRNVLSGNYGSVFKGRGMDFDDLRVYEYGDDVKDIDWKASARSRSPMIRRYVAVRKHNIMIVADAGRNMAALAPSGEEKKDIATFVAGIIAYIANKNTDLIGMTFGNNTGNSRFPLKEGVNHIENFLNKYEKSISLSSGKTDLAALLNYVSKNYRERMFLIIIADGFSVSKIPIDIFRKLSARHEQMVVMVDDAPMTNKLFSKDEARDISEDIRLPRYLRNNRKLRKAEENMRTAVQEKTTHELKRLGICSCVVSSVDDAVPKVFKMLEEQKHARK